MNKKIKKHIRILAEKFNHKIEYEKDSVLLKNDINQIRVWEEDKYGINISFNVSNELQELKIEYNKIYDVIIKLFRRKRNDEKLVLKSGILITIEEWIAEEGGFAQETLEKLKRDLKCKVIEYRNLGGNRYEAEYFKGLLILTDDLCWSNSNVIEL